MECREVEKSWVWWHRRTERSRPAWQDSVRKLNNIEGVIVVDVAWCWSTCLACSVPYGHFPVLE